MALQFRKSYIKDWHNRIVEMQRTECIKGILAKLPGIAIYEPWKSEATPEQVGRGRRFLLFEVLFIVAVICLFAGCVLALVRGWIVF